MGLFDDFLKNLDDTLGTFENNVKKLDDKLNGGIKQAEKGVDAAGKVLKNIDNVGQKAIDILKKNEQK